VSSPAINKAAMLLISLDPSSAAELLKGATPEFITDVVAEMAYLKASSDSTQQSLAPAMEFFKLLRERNKNQGQGFWQQLLEGAMGKEKAREALDKLQDMVEMKDPFIAIRSADVQSLISAMEGEGSQVVAMVLAELPAKKSAELLSKLPDAVRIEAVQGMAQGAETSIEVRRRVANLVLGRLKSPQLQAKGKKDAHIRKVAVLLRTLGNDMRNSLLKAIGEADKNSADQISRMMVTWEDITMISDRSLQEGLRGIDSKRLALALIGAEPQIADKVRKNLSERASAMLDEEAQLLSSPKPAEIEEARDAFLNDLRELNANNLLTFSED
jgi:flagellar motor switch protein FliG